MSIWLFPRSRFFLAVSILFEKFAISSKHSLNAFLIYLKLLYFAHCKLNIWHCSFFNLLSLAAEQSQKFWFGYYWKYFRRSNTLWKWNRILEKQISRFAGKIQWTPDENDSFAWEAMIFLIKINLKLLLFFQGFEQYEKYQ